MTTEATGTLARERLPVELVVVEDIVDALSFVVTHVVIVTGVGELSHLERGTEDGTAALC